MIRAAGIDLGGTKIETRLFGQDWSVVDTRRTATPQDYAALIREIEAHLRWVRSIDAQAPIGLGSPGFVDRKSGKMTTANLPATGRMLPADIEKAFGESVVFLNDCRSFTLSEAILGAGAGFTSVMGLVIGTGVAGGLAVNGSLLPDHNGISGEFGHMPLPARLVKEHGLPIVRCGCGRMGCIETLLAGPGLVRLAAHCGKDEVDTRVITTDPGFADVIDIWEALAGGLIATLMAALDPDCIVLGGGLSKIPDLAGRLGRATDLTLLPGTRTPEIRIAEGGPESGARGAALAAIEAANA